MANLIHSISQTHNALDAGGLTTETKSVTPVNVTSTVDNIVASNRLTVAEAASAAVPLDGVATPIIAYFYNTDDTNKLIIYDDATIISEIPAGQVALIPLPTGVLLKWKADTADLIADYKVYGTEV